MTFNTTGDRTYTFTYNAASAGQTLTLSWTDVAGQVTIAAAELVNSAPFVAIAASAAAKTCHIGLDHAECHGC